MESFFLRCCRDRVTRRSRSALLPSPRDLWETQRFSRDAWVTLLSPAQLYAALFTIARTGKQPRCPPADEWIRKQWYIYTMEYYSAIKMNTFESVLMRCAFTF